MLPEFKVFSCLVPQTFTALYRYRSVKGVAKMPFKRHPIAALIAGLFASSAVLADDTTSVGKISVQGDVGAESSGLMTAEESPKARSNVSREYIDKQNPASNPYQSLAMLPSVNTYSTDPYGLFGGNIRVRGFNSDQLGFTIDGAPVNDSGSFSVFPQEYTDTENLCGLFVTQGSTDTDAPHVGASGGNIGLVTCAPRDDAGVQLAETFGAFNLTKTFVRADTGALVNKRWKTFISYSKAMADKWRGDGRADRNHLDIKSEFKLAPGSSIKAGFLYNYAVNNNFRAMTRKQFDDQGYYSDFGLTAPNHLAPVNGTTQAEAAPSNNYYKYSINPFRNYIATMQASFALTKNLSFELDPYMWYGFGTGGNQLTALKEGSSGLNLGVKDLNGDGDKVDTVMIYNSSVTTTYRPGATAKFTYQLGRSNTISAGYWYEDAHHRQTGPGEALGTPGGSTDTVADKWLDNPTNWLLYNNGKVYESRDWLTENIASSIFIQDNITLMKDRLKIVPAFSHRELKRDFTNYANSGSGGGATYETEANYIQNQPSLGASFTFNEHHSIFADASRNSRAPSNFVLSGLVKTVSYDASGNQTAYTLVTPNVKAETSNNFDLGYRYQSEKYMFSGSVYDILLLNRIASAYDPARASSTNYNVGTSTIKGADLEGSVQIIPHLTTYTSASYSMSKMSNDFQATATATAPTAGKQLPDSPNWLFGERVQYQRDNYFAFVEGKYIGRRQSTLVNDENIPGYATANIGAGYQLPDLGFIKHTRIQTNLSNVTGQKYYSLNSGSGSGFTINSQPYAGQSSGTSPSYYTGAPFAWSVTVQADFM
jgi:iron complex outermembrane receptor protein